MVCGRLIQEMDGGWCACGGSATLFYSAINSAEALALFSRCQRHPLGPIDIDVKKFDGITQKISEEEFVELQAICKVMQS